MCDRVKHGRPPSSFVIEPIDEGALTPRTEKPCPETIPSTCARVDGVTSNPADLETVN